jgi:hypothetical protein
MNKGTAYVDLVQRTFLIVGLARNCGKRVRGDVLAISQAMCAPFTVSWLVVESDSTDLTLDALLELKDEIPNFRVISLGALRETLPLRTQRLAHCRNIYLAELQSSQSYRNVDYVIVADLDGGNGLLTQSGVSSCWSRTGWDVCTANQRAPYFDILALRHRLWSPVDCWQQYKFLTAHGARKEAARYAAVYSKMITLGENSEWIEVDSAFGGFAIYRRSALTGVEYVGLSDTGDEVCEHLSVHSQIRAKGGHIFINPMLINAGYTEHSQKRGLVPKMARYCGDCKRYMIRMLIK